jgi:enediyne biosynthesis protein E4
MVVRSQWTGCSRWVPVACFAGFLLLVAGLGAWRLLPRPAPPAEQPVGSRWFDEVTAEVGLSFVHDAGPSGDYFMPQIMGSGVALLDADGDGLLDVYLVHLGGSAGKKNQLFKQLADGTFKDVSAGSGLDIAGFNTGVAVGDVNNDGWPDVVVTQYGGLRLFLNNGNGTFTDATAGSGLENPAWATSAAFLDFDRDGLLDLVVVNYVAFDGATPCHSAISARDYCHPIQFPGQPARLFRNMGPQSGRHVRFEDVSKRSGLGQKPGPGLGVVCADFDGDGYPDIFVANDGAANHLWINQKDGTFKEEAVLRGLAFDGMGRAPANMGVALGDVDGDGLFDVFVTHLSKEMHTLWLQGPRGLFRDATVERGLAPPGSRGTGFGTLLADLDNDGHLDAAVVNGAIAATRGNPLDSKRLGPHYARYAELNQLFTGDRNGHFQDISRQELSFCRVPGVYRGLAVGDLGNRGALDLVVTEVAGPARLYRNVVPRRGNWLVVRALDPATKRDAYGAEVTVEAGQRRFTRWVNPGTSYLSSNDPRAHFGLGSVERVDRIRVIWPDGSQETFAGQPANRHVSLRKGEGQR